LWWFRMRTSSVLVVNLRGVACEVGKNIVLAGVGTVTLLDDAEVDEQDLGANYFVREDEVGHKVSTTSHTQLVQVVGLY